MTGRYSPDDGESGLWGYRCLIFRGNRDGTSRSGPGRGAAWGRKGSSEAGHSPGRHTGATLKWKSCSVSGLSLRRKHTKIRWNKDWLMQNGKAVHVFFCLFSSVVPTKWGSRSIRSHVLGESASFAVSGFFSCASSRALVSPFYSRNLLPNAFKNQWLGLQYFRMESAPQCDFFLGVILSWAVASAFTTNQCVGLGFLRAALPGELWACDAERELAHRAGSGGCYQRVLLLWVKFWKQRFLRVQFWEGDSAGHLTKYLGGFHLWNNSASKPISPKCRLHHYCLLLLQTVAGGNLRNVSCDNVLTLIPCW